MMRHYLLRPLVVLGMACAFACVQVRPADPPPQGTPTHAPLMEVATPDETAAFVTAQGSPPLLVFTEDRTRLVHREDALPQLWLQRPQTERTSFAGTAQPGEFYVFQVALYNSTDWPMRIAYARLDLPLPPTRQHCLNFATRPEDDPTLRDGLPLPPRTLKTLWLAVEAPDTIQTLSGPLNLACHDTVSGRCHTFTVPIQLTVAGDPVVAGGVNEGWRLARLRWLLPSPLGLTPEPTRGYAPVQRTGHVLSLTGKRLHLAASGLPQQIESRFSGSNTALDHEPRSLLAAPVQWVIETDQGRESLTPQGDLRFQEEGRDGLSWVADSVNSRFTLQCRGRLEFDGYLRYELRFIARQWVELRDLRLEVPYRADAARFAHGLGQRGGLRPRALDWHWDLSKHQDRFWLGDVNLGAQWQFMGANYHRPLVNIYYGFRPLRLPESWGNQGRGGVTLQEQTPETVVLTAYSGPRAMGGGEELNFNLAVLLTPSRPLDTESQWTVRYYHGGPDFIQQSLEGGANVINIHHTHELNPFINYPFNDLSVPDLTAMVRAAHARDLRVKLYYTTRELTQHLPEFFALHRLEGAVIQPGPGPLTRTLIHPRGPHPWLNEHLRTQFIPAWQADLLGKYAHLKDYAVLTRPDGAWNNFYLGGLDWLCERVQIDGVYIDDTALDRRSLLRARRILEARRPQPLIDLHSWNPFSPQDSFINSAGLYLELMPFVDRIWFGEGADYRQGPDAWLIQYSGIPYGVMGEMLEGGGNPWRGMLFGMTGRYPWAGDPRPMWRFWDAFGMRGVRLLGWWDPDCPVRTGRPEVPATVYQRPGKVLVALASWASEPVTLSLRVDWAALGLTPDPRVLRAEPIAGFQEAATFAADAALPVAPGKGWLLTIE